MFGATAIHTSPPASPRSSMSVIPSRPTTAQMGAAKPNPQKIPSPVQDAANNAVNNISEMLQGKYEQMKYWRRGITPLQLNPAQKRVTETIHKKLAESFESINNSGRPVDVCRNKNTIFKFESISKLEDSDILYLAAAQTAKKWLKS